MSSKVNIVGRIGRGRLMTPTILGATLENRPIVVIRVGQGISFMKPWDVIMTLPIEIGAGIIMQLWMP